MEFPPFDEWAKYGVGTVMLLIIAALAFSILANIFPNPANSRPRDWLWFSATGVVFAVSLLGASVLDMQRRYDAEAGTRAAQATVNGKWVTEGRDCAHADHFALQGASPLLITAEDKFLFIYDITVLSDGSLYAQNKADVTDASIFRREGNVLIEDTARQEKIRRVRC